MSDEATQPEQAMAALFEGLSRREQLALLGRLEKAGGGIYRALAEGERNRMAREKLLAAAGKEDENSSLTTLMGTLKGECEKCSQKLAPTSGHACSFQCTFCDPCTGTLAKVCPNCDGPLEPRH